MANKARIGSIDILKIDQFLTNEEILELADLVLRDEADLTAAQLITKAKLVAKSSNEEFVGPVDDPE